MSELGYYYLHTNGSLIYKRALDGIEADFRESDLVRAFWALDTSERQDAWRICVEGLAAGANKERVFELAEKWGCDDADAANYAELLGCTLSLDGDQWCAVPSWFVNLQESAAGFGDSCLEALAALAVELGYKPSKMWGNSFEMVLREPAA